MPPLGDYIGHLLSEIAIARMQADLESVRIAELYARHPLLRTLPVPHVRLPEVNLDVPVLVESAGQVGEGEPPRGGARLDDMKRKFAEVMDSHLRKAGVNMDPAARINLHREIDARFTRHEAAAGLSVDLRRAADDVTDAAISAVRMAMGRPGSTEPAISDEIARELREATHLEFIKLRTPPPRLNVLVTSDELRERGTPDNTTRLRLKVSEQGLEWTTVESQGELQDRLIPE